MTAQLKSIPSQFLPYSVSPAAQYCKFMMQ
jgi:hypothetical protein